jgi:hypothetical protein
MKHYLDKDKKNYFRVYDAGEKSGLDRYTAVFYGPDWTFKVENDARIWHHMLFMSPGGWAVSQWASYPLTAVRLGRPVPLAALDKDTLQHIIWRAAAAGK